jgi:polysaccharide biosynthesis/export protein
MKHPFRFVIAAAVAVSAVAGARPAAAAGADTVVVPTADYRLELGDKLRIEVYKDPQMSQSVQIRPDGKITLPLVGDIVATGKTPAELRDELTTDLSEYINHPVVTVIVVEATAPVVYVVGEVARPGAVTLTTGRLTVLQALAMAGGLKDFANRKHINILRPSFTGQRTLEFNYEDAIHGSAPTFLQPGDTVVVPD